jgi:predicted dehydrogenase
MINVAVIGCGYWGPNLVRNFHEVPDAQVAIVCDTDRNRLDFIKKRYPSLKVTKDARTIFDDPEIDAVCIATPVVSHFELAHQALLHDKHVLVEKPMTRHIHEAEELIKVAEERKRVLMVGHTFEYHGAVRKIKEIVEKGELGKVFYVDSSRLNTELFRGDINVLWDLAPHDISILLFVLEKKPIALRAEGRCYIREGIEEVAFLTIYFPQNIVAHIHVSWLAPLKFRRTVIVGSKKMILYDDLDYSDKVKVYDKGVEVVEDVNSLLGRQLLFRTGDVSVPRLDQTEPLRRECTHFIQCVREGRRPQTDGRVGLEVVKVLDAAQRSMEERGAYIEL